MWWWKRVLPVVLALCLVCVGGSSALADTRTERATVGSSFVEGDHVQLPLKIVEYTIEDVINFLQWDAVLWDGDVIRTDVQP